MKIKLNWTFGLSGNEYIELEKGSTMKDLKELLSGDYFITVNGLNRPDTYVILDEDEISIMPVLEGG